MGDEGGICLKHISKERGQNKCVKGRTIGLLVLFVSANGSVLVLVWIFKASTASNESKHSLLDVKFHIKLESRSLRRSWKRYYAFTASGYSNRELHGQIMDWFGKVWMEQHLTDYCWLFGDQLAAHKCPQTVEKCLEQRVMSWLLLANTSHFLQPLKNKILHTSSRSSKLVARSLQLGIL